MTKNPIGTPSRDCGTHNRSPSPSLWSVAAQRQGFVQSLKMGTAGGGEEGRRGPPGKMHLGQKGSTGKPPQGGGCRDPPSKGWCPRGGRHRGTSAGRCCGVRADREPPRGGGSAASGKEGRTRKAEPDAVPVPPISPRFPPVPPPPTCPGRASNAAAVRQRGAPSGCARRSAGLRGGTGTGGGTGGHGGHRLQSAPARPGLPHPPRSPAPPPPLGHCRTHSFGLLLRGLAQRWTGTGSAGTPASPSVAQVPAAPGERFHVALERFSRALL